MAQGAEKIVEILQPVVISALAAAAQALVSGPVFAERRAWTANKNAALSGRNRRAKRHAAIAADDDPGTTISNDTWQYVESNFATNFGYYYEGLSSQPVSGDVPQAAGEDIIIWQTSNGLSNIQAYLQTAFKDALSPADSIEFSKNLSVLFQDRFKETSLEWTPFFKRYNFADKVVVDCYMVTSPATDAQGNPAGIASYCWVAYNHDK
jgi:hypothetical protein